MYYRNGAVEKGIWENGQLVRWLANTSDSRPTQTPTVGVTVTALRNNKIVVGPESIFNP